MTLNHPFRSLTVPPQDTVFYVAPAVHSQEVNENAYINDILEYKMTHKIILSLISTR